MAELSETVTARPQRSRKVAYVAAGSVVVVFTVVALLLKGKTDSGRSMFRPEDQVAMALLGLLAAAGILMFARPKMIADATGLRIRNLTGWREVEWSLVVAVRFDRGSPWVTLDLQDDDVITVMAVQAADKDYAVRAVRALRALLAASRARPAQPA